MKARCTRLNQSDKTLFRRTTLARRAHAFAHIKFGSASRALRCEELLRCHTETKGGREVQIIERAARRGSLAERSRFTTSRSAKCIARARWHWISERGGACALWCGRLTICCVWCGVVWCGVVWCGVAVDRAKIGLKTSPRGRPPIQREESVGKWSGLECAEQTSHVAKETEGTERSR